jgi:acyl-CoA reductase-like NAD-dependent aldehyde dehydrogenase
MVESGQCFDDPMMGVDKVDSTLKRLKAHFMTGATRSVEWRKAQLQQLIIGMKALEAEFIEAYYKDTGRDACIYKL